MNAAQKTAFYKTIFYPTVFHVLTVAFEHDNIWTQLQLSEVFKACTPVLRDVFTWSGRCSPRLAKNGSPIAYRSPPPGAPKVPYRVVVAMRDTFLTPLPSTRQMDIGPRFVEAARSYGWASRLCLLQFVDLVADLQRVIADCRSFCADILILDDDFIASPETHGFRAAMISRLRAMCPSIKIVGLHLDAWQIAPDVFRRTTDDLDAIWATTPSMQLWAEPVFTGKILLAPLVHAGQSKTPQAEPPNRIRFVGSMLQYNWPRILWRAASVSAELPIEWQLTYHMREDIAPLQSYADYMTRLSETGCALNLSMRNDLSRVITDRSFEAMLAGCLLIQELSPDLDHFFVEGEHFLSFGNLAELRAACNFVLAEPQMAQRIQLNGHEFAVSRYADERLMGYLDALLFHTHPASA
jgi:hypothetical protein